MAEAPGGTGSIASIVAYGLKLGTTLQIYSEGLSDTKKRLCDLAVDINTTACALKHLQDAVDADEASLYHTKVFKDEGLQEIENVAAQCAKIYSTIIIIITKAGNLSSMGKTAASFGDMPVLKASSLLRTLRWAWLEPRVKRAEEQLRWLKMKVLLNLQLAGLAKVQLGIPERAPGSFDEELALRAMAHRIKRRERKYLEKLATKYRISKILEIDSPFNASNISLPMPIPDLAPPMEIPDPRPAESVSGLPKKGALGNPINTVEVEVILQKVKNARLDSTPADIAVDEAMKAIGMDQVRPVMPSPKAVSSTITSDTMVQDQQSDNEVAAAKDDANKVEVEVAKPSESPAAKPQAEPSSEPSSPKDDKPQEESEDSQPPIDKTSAISPFPDFESKPSVVSSWWKGMFGQTNKISNQSDWESQTLEAYIIPEDSNALLKIPLGHQTLSQGFKSMKKQCLHWDQYTALGSPHHKRINQAVLEAKRLDSRERTCIAVGLNKEFGSERIMLFFLVGGPVEPVHLKDAVGRKFSFPYEQCRTWPLMKALIDQAFLHVEVIGTHVNEGHYDLINEDGNIILPDVFDHMVKPGSKISQHMWPMPTPRNKRPGPPPGGPPGPPGPPPGVFGPPPGVRPGGLGEPPVIINLANKPPGPPNPNAGVLGWMAGNHGHGTDDSSVLVSDSDIEDEPEDLGLEIDFDREDENTKLNLGELLAKFTNATDTVHDVFEDDDDSSDDDSSSSSTSLVSD